MRQLACSTARPITPAPPKMEAATVTAFTGPYPGITAARGDYTINVLICDGDFLFPFDLYFSGGSERWRVWHRSVPAGPRVRGNGLLVSRSILEPLGDGSGKRSSRRTHTENKTPPYKTRPVRAQKSNQRIFPTSTYSKHVMVDRSLRKISTVVLWKSSRIATAWFIRS